jgi:hypothetical protein
LDMRRRPPGIVRERASLVSLSKGCAYRAPIACGAQATCKCVKVGAALKPADRLKRSRIKSMLKTPHQI